MGPTRRGDANNARGTPYDRPSGSTQNPASARDRDLVRLGESSQPSHRPKSMQADDAERRSSWSSWVYTPLKALKVMKVENPGHQDFWAVLHYKIQRIMMIDTKLQESYNYLSKSPIKPDEVDENVGGALRGAPLYVYCRLRFHYRLYKFSARNHNCVIHLCMVQDIMSIRPPAQQLQRWLRKERWVPCLAVAASGTCIQQVFL